MTTIPDRVSKLEDAFLSQAAILQEHTSILKGVAEVLSRVVETQQEHTSVLSRVVETQQEHTTLLKAIVSTLLEHSTDLAVIKAQVEEKDEI